MLSLCAIPAAKSRLADAMALATRTQEACTMILEHEAQRATYFHAFDKLLFVRIGYCWGERSPPLWPTPGRLTLAYQTHNRGGWPALYRIAYAHVWEGEIDCLEPCDDQNIVTPESFKPNQSGERPKEWLASVVYEAFKAARSHYEQHVQQQWNRMVQHARHHHYEIAKPVATPLIPIFGFAPWSGT